MKLIKKFLLWTVTIIVLLAVAVAALAYWWFYKRPVQMQAQVVDYAVETGSSLRKIATVMQTAGIAVTGNELVLLARISNRDKLLKAGAYEAKQGDTIWQLLERMANGDMTQTRLTFPEGWTVKQIRAALDNSADVKHDTAGLSDAELIQLLGLPQQSLEGLIYPDTYVFTPGSSDLEILRRSVNMGQQVLEQAWAGRARDLPLKNSYQALILASIIEKETGHGQDRAKVAGVFINRLRIGMPLQTDPSVIYGMGERYQGRIRKADLERDTAWNTYTRNGLPPTPIASPGKASILAALHPDEHKYLYFVSRGDGTSEFSQNLRQHNNAVNKYILKRN